MMKHLAWVLLLALTAALVPLSAQALEEDVYTIYDSHGEVLTHYCGECDTGDEYISGDNQHYRVVTVDEANQTAVAEHLGAASMPDVSWLDMDASVPVSATQRRIALYCTHSDESYVTGDGTESDEERGGIYDIAAAFAKELEALGVTVDLSEQTHHPHDAGAYRRSRQTAVELLKSQPNAIFDIHRDGIPDPDEYASTIGGEPVSMVRLLVGKSNQNNEANLSFAKQIKAVADSMYPGLIKDIYMGKGTYNQDLAPRSVLLEFGTHTIDKDLVLAATEPLSNVVYKALFGGVTGSAGASDVSSRSSARDETPAQPASEDNAGWSWAIWLVVALVAGLGVFAFLSTGGRGAMRKWGRSFSEMTGGLFGKRPPKGE